MCVRTAGISQDSDMEFVEETPGVRLDEESGVFMSIDQVLYD